MIISQEILSWIGTIASVIAAVVAIFLMVWTVRRDVRDKGALRIEFAPVWDEAAIKAGNTDKAIIPCCRITNVGTQLITAQHILLEIENFAGQFSWGYKNLPRVLQPSEWVMEPFEMKVVSDRLMGILVVDSFGKTWRAPQVEVERLKEWCASLSENEPSPGQA